MTRVKAENRALTFFRFRVIYMGGGERIETRTNENRSPIRIVQTHPAKFDGRRGDITTRILSDTGKAY